MQSIREYISGLKIEGSPNNLAISFDASMHDKATLVWADDPDDSELSNLIADIIVDCNIDIAKLLTIVAELQK